MVAPQPSAASSSSSNDPTRHHAPATAAVLPDSTHAVLHAHHEQQHGDADHAGHAAAAAAAGARHEGGDEVAGVSPAEERQEQEGGAELTRTDGQDEVKEHVGDAAEPRPCCSGRSGTSASNTEASDHAAPASSADRSPAAAAAAGGASRSDKVSGKGGRKGSPMLPLLLLGAVAVPAVAWLRKRLAQRQQGSSSGTNGSGNAAPGSAKGHKQRGGKSQQQGAAAVAPAPAVEAPPAPDALPALLSVPAALSPPPPPPITMGYPPLTSLRLVVGEDVDITGAPTTHGLVHLPAAPSAPPAPSPPPPASSTAPAVSRLVSAGAACLGKTAVQPLSQELVGANVGTPLNRYRSAGGGNTGAAVAVATGVADLAVCADSAGEARVPAACCGLYALRPTPGTLGPSQEARPCEGPGGEGTEEGESKVGLPPSGLTLVARDTNLLTKAADVLKLPGSANLRGEILKFVVAQDLFELCAPELQPATLAVKKAILRWAGAEQAGAVQLVQFLASNTSAWVEVEAAVKRQLEARGGKGAGQGQGEKEKEVVLHPFIEAAVAAAQALSLEEQWRGLSKEERGWLAALTSLPAAAAAGASTAADAAGADGEAADGGEQQGDGAEAERDKAGDGEDGGAEEGSSGAAGAAAAAEPAARMSAVAGLLRPSPELVKASVALAREVGEVLRQTVKPDTLLVLPALPFPPPRRPAASATPDASLDPTAAVGDDPGEHAVFTKLVRCFHAFASLGGCPSLTCPVGTLRDGSPVSVTIVGVAKWDLRLLAASGKLVPMIHDCFRAIKEEITALAAAERQQAAAAGAGAGPTGAAGAGAGSPSQSSGRASVAGTGAGASASSPTQGPRSPGSAGAPGAPGGRLSNSNSGSVSSTGATAGSMGSAASSAASLSSASVDPKRLDKAEKFKAKGNQLYTAGKFLEAVTEYTKAINTHPNSPVYYNNRAMACIKLFRFEQAEEDCCKALSFPDLPEKDRVKALLRRATARDALQRLEEAERDLREVLRLEPGNRQAREDLTALRRHKEEMGAATAAMVQAMRQQGAGGGAGGDRAQAAAAMAAAGMLPPGFDPSMLPAGFDPSSVLPPGFDPASLLPPGMDPAMFRAGFDPSQLGYGREGGEGY